METVQMEAINIIHLFVEDHEKIASSLGEFKNSLGKERKKAAQIFNQLSKDLIRHFHQEEILYSNYKHTAGEILPIIQTIRKEHEIILKGVNKIKNSLKKGSTDINTDKLFSLLERHKNIEDILLYPELDRVLSDKEKEEIYWKMKVN